MLGIFINNINRIKEQKGQVIFSIALTILAAIMAIFMTNNFESKLSVALIGTNSNLESNEKINITSLNEMPSKSELVQNKYDAVVSFEKDGKYDITSIKSDEISQIIRSTIDGDSIDNSENERKIGTNIIGYMMMFILMQGVIYARLFGEDKEKHLIERISVSPVSFSRYFLSNMLFSIIFIMVPTLIPIVISDIIGIEIGFSILMYALLIGELSILATCFALFINSFFKVADTANMIGSATIILTTVLSGSFYDVASEGKLLFILPQKGFMYFLEHFEHNNINYLAILGVIYVFFCSIILLIIGVTKTKKQYVYGVDK